MPERSGDVDRVEGAVEETKGHMKQAWGDMTDDEKMKAEGMMDEMKGKAQQAWGDVKNAADDIKEDVERATR